MLKYFKKISWLLSVVLIGVIFGLGVGMVKAWDEPKQSPPEGNVPAPINVGPNAQAKAGGLILGTNKPLNDLGLLVVNGKVGIGTTTPTQKLDVAGYVRGSTGLCIGNDCRTDWGATRNLQCPPKRVMVDEESLDWNEWAQYDNCSAGIWEGTLYVALIGTKIYDNGNGFHLWSEHDESCIAFCQEFGFSSGEVIGRTLPSQGSFYGYYYEGGKWKKTAGEVSGVVNRCYCFQ